MSISDTNVRAFADSTVMVLISRVAMALAVPAMVWMLSSITSMRSDIAAMKVQISNASDDRYHRAEAISDFALRDARIDRSNTDIAQLTGAQNKQADSIAHLLEATQENARRIDQLESRRTLPDSMMRR